MKPFLLSLFFVFTACNDILTTPKEVPHGTLIVAVICNDGILIASDSRAAFTITTDSVGKNGRKIEKVYAYFDNNRKIARLGNWQIGISGLSMLGKKYVTDLCAEFSKTHAQLEIRETFYEFVGYLEKRGIKRKEIFGENQYIMAGYENSTPVIFSHGFEGEVLERRRGSATYSDAEFKSYLSKPNNVPLNCASVAPYLEKSFNTYSNIKSDYMIGGPLQMVQIKPDNTLIIIKDFKSHEYKTYKEAAEGIFSGEVPVTYLYKNSRELLIRTLKDGIKAGF